jgi:hypothetical protein
MRIAARANANLRITAARGVRYERVAPVLGEARAARVAGIDVALEPR